MALSVPPAFPTQPDLLGPDGIAVWYTEPAGVVLQHVRPARVTVPQVEWLLGAGYEAFRQRFPGAKARLTVLDLSNMVERDPAARAMMLRRGPLYSSGLTTYLIPPAASHRILVMSVTAGAALMRALGISVEVRRSFVEVQKELGLAHAAPARPAT